MLFKEKLILSSNYLTFSKDQGIKWVLFQAWKVEKENPELVYSREM